MSATARRRLQWSGAVMLYVTLALLVTWPVARQFSTHVAGFPGRDSLQYTWSLWWSRQAWLSGQSPAEATLLYRPWQATNPLLAVAPMLDWLAFPLFTVLTPTQVYNTLFLLSLVFSGLAMFWLALDRTQHYGGALLAGVLYAYAAPRLGHALLGHLTHLASWWFPLAALFGLRALDHPRLRPALLCGLCAGLGVLVAPVQAAYLVAPGLLLLLGGEAVRRHQELSRGHLWAGIAAVVTAAVVIAPSYGPFVVESLRESRDLSAVGVEAYSVDPVMLVTPSPFHPLWGGLVQRFSYARTAIPEANDLEKIAYLGLLPIGLAAVGWLHSKHGRWVWLMVSVVAIILAMGPELALAGRATGVPLPYALLQRLPLFSWGRTPERFLQLASFGLAMLCAYSLRDLRARGWLTAAIVAVCLLGSLPMWPFPEGTPKPPEQLTGLRDTDGVVLDLPISKRQIGNLAMYYQTEHGLPIIGGYIHRDPEGQRAYVKALDAAILGQREGAVRTLTPSELEGLLQGLGVRHVLVHRDFVRATDVANTAELLSAALGAPPQDWGSVLAFAVAPLPSEPAPEAVYGEGIDLSVVSLQADEGRVVVMLRWRAETTPQHPWTVFVHLLDGQGRRVAQHDGEPAGGNLSMSLWAPGQTVLDEHVLTFEGLPAEDWTLAVGLYDAATGERVPVTTAGLPVQDDAVLLKLDD
ncbi:MAG: hypothetical protein ABFD20_06440 [Anaerolineales bacterium]